MMDEGDHGQNRRADTGGEQASGSILSGMQSQRAVTALPALTGCE